MKYLFSLFICFSIFAQNTLQQELVFVKHLIQIENYSESLLYSNDLLERFKENSSFIDSLWYYQGYAHYAQKLLPEAIENHNNVSKQNSFYLPAQFWMVYLHTHLRAYNNAEILLSNLSPIQSVHKELATFQSASIALIKKDLPEFNRLQEEFTGKFYQFSKEEQNLNEIGQKIANKGKKSPFLAGVLSAIIPGLGKVYSGKVKQGIGSFIPLTILGFQVLENINKRGFEHPLSLFYTTIFSAFYIGNIWGSALSVNIVEQEFNDEIKKEVLFNMHIPLRNLFRSDFE